MTGNPGIVGGDQVVFFQHVGGKPVAELTVNNVHIPKSKKIEFADLLGMYETVGRFYITKLVWARWLEVDTQDRGNFLAVVMEAAFYKTRIRRRVVR